jgi:hypothetical protein
MEGKMFCTTLLTATLALSAADLPRVEPPPPPNFAKPVDYVAWYREQLEPAQESNAVDAYAPFLYTEGTTPAAPITVNPETAVGTQLHAVLAAPNAWDKSEHEALALWVKKMAELYFKPYMAGADKEHFALRVDPKLEFLADMPIPPLANGRIIGQMMFARSWLLTDHTLYVNTMVEAVRGTTAYGCHVCEGLSVYEQFIGAGVRQMAYEQISLSLGHSIRLPEHWVKVVDAFEKTDQTSMMQCYARSLYFSEAAALQLLQYFFPVTGDEQGTGQPKLVLDRVHGYFAAHDQPQRPRGDALDQLAKADPAKLAKAIHDYYAGMRAILTAPAVSDLADRMKKLNADTFEAQPAMKVFVLPLDFLVQSCIEQEANRRMLHLFLRMALEYKQTGEWPAGLDDLHGVGIDACKTDPFSGKPFKIHYFKVGPALYSVGPDGHDDGANPKKDIVFRPKI